jgi:hypothetical protein
MTLRPRSTGAEELPGAAPGPLPRRRKRISGTALAVLLLVLAVVVAIVAVTAGLAHARGALKDRLDRVRASGAPLSGGEIDWQPPGAGLDPLPWLEEVEALLERYDEALEPEWDARWRAILEGIPDSRERVSAASDDRWTFYDQLDRDLGDPRLGPELATTYGALLALRVEESAASLALARRVDDHARIDMRAAFGDRWGSAVLTVELPITACIELQNALAAAAVDASARGAADEALADLRRMFRVADLLAGSPTALGFQARFMLTHMALHQSLVSANLLPPGSIGPHVEPLLEAFDPTRDLRFALQCERAWIHGVFDEVRQGKGMLEAFGDIHPLEAWLMRLLADVDEPAALDRFEILLGCLEGPWHEASQRVPELEREPVLWQPISAMSALPARVTFLDRELVAYRAVLAAALRARDRGMDAGVELADRTPDPFGTGSLRSRREPGGVLVVWSIGPDALDQEAACDELACDDLSMRARAEP